MKVILICAVVCLSSTHLMAKEVRKTAKTYVSTRMYTYFSWDKQCRSTRGVVELIKRPANGILATNEVEEKIFRSRSRPDKPSPCEGTPIKGFRVDYISNAGFKGTDTFQVKVNYRNKPPEIDNFIVTVQ